ncbi:MAG TPA: hypothetical protein VLC95_02920 [Anaerolineae bacterium]|nr:hypothetical protein [Anaerolineae bacterium]
MSKQTGIQTHQARSSSSPQPSGVLQRACDCGATRGPTRECGGCRRGRGPGGDAAQQVTNVRTPVVQRQPTSEPARIPDVPRLATQLSDDIGDNLHTYGHHFYRIATLYPDRPELLEGAFARYALGKNVLESGLRFLGAEPGTASALALGTGITFKGVNLLAKGELVIDYQLDLGKGVKLEAGLDLAVNPDDVTDVKKADATLSLVGRF